MSPCVQGAQLAAAQPQPRDRKRASSSSKTSKMAASDSDAVALNKKRLATAVSVRRVFDAMPGCSWYLMNDARACSQDVLRKTMHKSNAKFLEIYKE